MKVIQFPRWAEVLEKSDLPEKQRESYQVTLRWYLAWCHRTSVGCSVQSARDFVEWAQKEKSASDWMVERWQESIRWFFVMAKAQAVGDLGAGDEMAVQGNPSAGSMRVGRNSIQGDCYKSLNDTDGERIEAANETETAVLALMRRRGMALKTERSYLR